MTELKKLKLMKFYAMNVILMCNILKQKVFHTCDRKFFILGLENILSYLVDSLSISHFVVAIVNTFEISYC